MPTLICTPPLRCCNPAPTGAAAHAWRPPHGTRPGPEPHLRSFCCWGLKQYNTEATYLAGDGREARGWAVAHSWAMAHSRQAADAPSLRAQGRQGTGAAARKHADGRSIPQSRQLATAEGDTHHRGQMMRPTRKSWAAGWEGRGGRGVRGAGGAGSAWASMQVGSTVLEAGTMLAAFSAFVQLQHGMATTQPS